MLKAILDFVKQQGFTITENASNLIVGYDTKTLLVIVALHNNHITICKENTDNIKFEGIIDNTQQLKVILNCIKKGL